MDWIHRFGGKFFTLFRQWIIMMVCILSLVDPNWK